MKPKPLLTLKLRTATLGFVVLVAQAFAVVHPLDLAAHIGVQPCEICISVANLDIGDSAQATTTIVIDTAHFDVLVAPSVPPNRSPASTYFARAPPNAS